VTDYLQNYNPTGHAVLSTLAAAAPVMTLLYLLAAHPTRDRDGNRHHGIAAHLAAICAVAWSRMSVLVAKFRRV